MGAGSVTLGGTLLPAPSGFTRTPASIGDAHQLADGSETWDHLAFKHEWSFTWTALNSAERGTVRSTWQTSGTVSLNDWDGTVGVVHPARHPLAETPLYLNGTTYYDLSLRMREV